MSTQEDLIKANEERFKQWMDQHLNFPDGGDPQFRPSQTTEAVYETPLPHPPAFDAVHGTLMNDPEVQRICYEHLLDKSQPVDIGPQPYHPAEQMSWIVLKDCNALLHNHYNKQFEDGFKYRTQNRTKRMLEKLSQHDPMFALTQDVMAHYVKGLPPSAQRALERLFSRSPDDTLKFYQEIRRAAEKVVHKVNSRRRKR